MFHLTNLFSITSDTDLCFEQKIEKLLILGASKLNLQLGIISRIVDDTYTVEYATSPEDSLTAGSTFVYQNTYCVHTLNANRVLCFAHAGKSEIANHPCYLDFGLESYIGAPLIVDGKPYGTLNFSSADVRQQPFSQQDEDFIEFLSHWIGNEITKNQQLSLLQNQRRKLINQQNILGEIGVLAGVGAWEVDLVNNKVHWSDATRIIHEVDKNFIPELETAINFYREGPSRNKIQKLVEKAMQDGSEFGGEFEIVTPAGNIKWVAVTAKADLENNQCVRLYGAFQDITQQVYYRQQLEQRHQELTSALEARSAFLANMSHEIRTPINGVIGSLQVMDKSNLNDNQQHFLHLAQSSANSLLEQVNDVLDFAKIDSNQIQLEPRAFEVNKILKDCLDVFTVSAQEKAVKLNADFTDTQGKMVVSDPTRLKQICANLIGNAIKFSHQGEVSVTSHLTTSDTGQCQLTVCVKDNGIGIPEHKLSQLFLPFRQADISTTRKFGGTGLGLSISHSLAQLMQGDIKVQSEERKGSTFTVTVGVELPESEQPNKDNNKGASQQTNKDLGQLKVLVVEDNFINQMVVSEMLKVKGIEHDIAEDGIEALDIVKQSIDTPYSLILMDCQMPNMDGYQATENIRQLAAPLNRTPIVALTANAMKADKEKCFDSGMNDYLAKPLEQQLLYEMLEKYI